MADIAQAFRKQQIVPDNGVTPAEGAGTKEEKSPISEKTAKFRETLEKYAVELEKNGIEVTLEKLVKKIVSEYQMNSGEYIDIKAPFKFQKDQISIGLAIEIVLRKRNIKTEDLMNLFKPIVQECKGHRGSDEESVKIMTRNIIIGEHGELYYTLISSYLGFAIRHEYDKDRETELSK